MKKRFFVVFLCIALLCLYGCSIQPPIERKEEVNVQYFFSGKVQEVQEEYLVLEVYYTGNANLTEGTVVEVSTDVVAAAGCPEFVTGEKASVVMAWNVEEQPAERLNTLAIYKEDEDGHAYAVGGESPKEDLLTLLKSNYEGKIPSFAASPYVLQADASSCMIVFGQGATTLIYVTRDGGATWEQAEIPEAGGHQHAVVTCAAAISGTTYCIGYRYWGEYDGTNFYLTEDCGKTWARISPEEEISEEITANMRYAEAVAANYVDDRLQVQVSCKTTVFPPWSIEVKLESADLGETWIVVEIWEKETDAE